MTAALQKIETRSDAYPDDLPISVIGAGPVGIRTLQALLRRAATSRIIIYGDEPWAPYNRVQLLSTRTVRAPISKWGMSWAVW